MEETGWRHKTVCIVDDDERVRDIYQRRFENEGFVVITAINGAEGLTLIREKVPDVIVLDMQMPELDGLGVLKVLKEDVKLAKIPVVVLSNVEDDEVFQQVESLGGARYYLIKSLTETQKVVDIALQALMDQ